MRKAWNLEEKSLRPSHRSVLSSSIFPFREWAHSLGRMLQRIGSAYLKKGEIEIAVDYLKKAIAEERTAETLKLLRQAENELEEAKKRAYLDPALSEKAKEEGNEFFRSHKFPAAVERYTEVPLPPLSAWQVSHSYYQAIKRNPSNHALYSNRATAYTKVRN